MTPELTKAAQQALEALKHGVAQLNGIGIPLEAEPLHTAITALERTLNQRPAEQTEREAFEAEMRCEETWGHRSLKKRPDGRYQNWQVDVMWDVWQARASLPAPQQATPEPLIVKGAMAGMVDAQVRDLWPTKGATPEPVGEVVWIQPNHLQKARFAPHLCRVAPSRIAPDFVPLSRPAPGVPDGWQPIQTAPTDGTKFLGWRRGQVATSYRVPRDDCEMWCFGGTSGAFEHWPETRPEFWMPHPPEPAIAAAQAKGDAHD